MKLGSRAIVCGISNWCWFGGFVSWGLEVLNDCLSESKHLEWEGMLMWLGGMKKCILGMSCIFDIKL